jgi:hypothetical protein
MTPLTNEQVASIKATIAAIAGDVNGAVKAASTVYPPAAALAPLVALGSAVASQVPGLVQDIELLLAGTPPTDADVQALHATIAALANPASL